MSSFVRVAWNPTERVARAAMWIDNHFGPHRYGVSFEGDPQIYRQDEAEIPIDMTLAPIGENKE